MQLEDFVDRLEGATLRGSYVTGLCPFHDDHNPSLAVYQNGGYKCFACGAKGPWSQLWDAVERGGIYNWSPAPKNLNFIRPSWNNVSPGDYARAMHTVLITHPVYQEYLIDRKVESLIEPCQIGYENGWYIIPVFGQRNNVVGLVARAGPEMEDDASLRFDTPYGQGSFPYSPNWGAFAKAVDIFVVFGIFDALALATCGYACLTPTLGKKSTDPAWFDAYSKRIFILPDAGEYDAGLDLARGLDWRGRVAHIEYEKYTNCKDPADILKHHGKGALIDAITESVRDVGGVGTP